MKKIVIVDYGMGNLHSVSKALSYVCDKNTKIIISNKACDINSADKVVLPGQGAIAGCMEHINAQGLYEAIQNATKTKPFLAICIGPQLLMDFSEENGGVKGFGVFKGQSKRFDKSLPKQNPPLKIPHMGWSEVRQVKEHKLWDKIPQNSRFYFVHSYYLIPEDKSTEFGTCDYGGTFTSAIARDNIFTTQCHPEKSSTVGLKLFENFINWKI